MQTQSCVEIVNELDIVEARQLGRDIAHDMGFGTVDEARIVTTISELSRNIYLYAGRGQICFETADQPNGVNLIIIASDSGPGIKNISDVMEDGYSTSGSLGAGLPGVKRLMDEFDIQSEEDKGTEIRAVKYLLSMQNDKDESTLEY